MWGEKWWWSEPFSEGNCHEKFPAHEQSDISLLKQVVMFHTGDSMCPTYSRYALNSPLQFFCFLWMCVSGSVLQWQQTEIEAGWLCSSRWEGFSLDSQWKSQVIVQERHSCVLQNKSLSLTCCSLPEAWWWQQLVNAGFVWICKLSFQQSY